MKVIGSEVGIDGKSFRVKVVGNAIEFVPIIPEKKSGRCARVDGQRRHKHEQGC
jgi:hypothetical protein